MKINLNNRVSFGAQWSKELAPEVEAHYQNTLKTGDIKEIERLRSALSTIDRHMKAAKIEKIETPYSDYFVSTIKKPQDWTMLNHAYTFEHPVKVKGPINTDTLMEIASDLMESDEYIKSEREKNPRCVPEKTDKITKLRYVYQSAQPAMHWMIYNNTDEKTYKKLYDYVYSQKPVEFTQDELFTSIRALIEIRNHAENYLEYTTQRAFHQKDYGYACKEKISEASLIEGRVTRAMQQLLKQADNDTKMKIYEKPNMHVYSEE